MKPGDATSDAGKPGDATSGMGTGSDAPMRCTWATSTAAMAEYHDTEWGVPVHDDRQLFEALTLEGAQAGLSWATILNKRENYRRAFDGFEIEAVARYDEAKLAGLLDDAGIVRNRLKIRSTVANARALLEVQREHGSFAAFIWSFVDGKTIVNRFESQAELPARTELSTAMSKALLARGFRFVGPTICYSFMQAVGMVHDHLLSCHRYGADVA